MGDRKMEKGDVWEGGVGEKKEKNDKEKGKKIG